MDLNVQPAKSLKGEITVPGDKSISHRAAMIGSLAEGTTEICGFLHGEDCTSTIHCMQNMGVRFEGLGGEVIKVHGLGLGRLQEPADILDAGNSGTTIRLLSGILAGLRGYAVITGDASLRQRPMRRVTAPLIEMGARIWGRNNGEYAPLSVLGGKLQAIQYNTPVASAQVKSAILLAGLHTEGTTSVREPAPSRDHTERMLQAFGAKVSRGGEQLICVEGWPRLAGQKVVIPGDISSAAFFLVAGCIVPGSEILIKNVGVNWTRSGMIEILQKMGGDVSVIHEREETGEAVADLRVKYGPLQGVEVNGSMIPRLIDEIPVLAVAAAAATGTTVIRDAAELRVKESDRIGALARELGRLGARITELPDGLIIEGGARLRGQPCHSGGDHRMAMALAVAGLVANGETDVDNAESINVSFPGFVETLQFLQR